MTLHQNMNQFLFEFNLIDIKNRQIYVEQHKSLIKSIKWYELINLIFTTIVNTDNIIQLLSFIKDENKLSIDILTKIYSFNSRAEYDKNQIIINYYINKINEQVFIDDMSSDLIFNCLFYLYQKSIPCNDQYQINFELFLDKQMINNKLCHYGILESINDAIFLDFLHIEKANKVINILLRNGLIPYNYKDVSLITDNFNIEEPYHSVLNNIKMLYDYKKEDISIVYQQLLLNPTCEIKDISFE